MKQASTIDGTAQRQVQEAIDELVESGAERGIQVAAYRGGERVVDAVARVADPATGRPVTSDTPFYNFSIVKGAASTLVHILAERGRFGYDTPVVELWPEIGAHGKQKVTVRQVLNHSARVPSPFRRLSSSTYPGHLGSLTKSISACRNRSTTDWPGWKTRRCLRGRCPRCHRTFRCSGPRR